MLRQDRRKMKKYRNQVICWLLLALLLAFLVIYLSFYQKKEDRTAAEGDAAPAQQLLVVCDYELPAQQDALSAAAEEFSRETGTAVQVQFMDSDAVLKNGEYRAWSLSEADIVICSYTDLSYLMYAGELQELELSDAGLQESDFISAGILLPLRRNGKLYGIPFMGDQYVLYADEESMHNAAVRKVSSWEDVYEICAQRNRNLVYGIGIGGRRQTEGAYLLQLLLYGNGCSNYTIDSEQGREVLEALLVLNQNGYLNRDSSIMTAMDMTQDFIQGHEAMIIAPYQYSGYIAAAAGREIEVSGLPGGVRSGGVLSYKGIGLTENAEEEAEEFLRYLFRYAVRETLRGEIDNLPLLREDLESSTEMEKELAEGENVIDVDAAWSSISEVYARALRELLLDRELQPDTCARDLQEKVKVAFLKN